MSSRASCRRSSPRAFGRVALVLALGFFLAGAAGRAGAATAELIPQLSDAGAFQPGDTQVVSALLSPGATTSPVDAFLVLRLPDGQMLSLQPDGTLVPGLVPVARAVVPFDFHGEVLRYTFSGGEPTGVYRWLAALTDVATGALLGPVRPAVFTFGLTPLAPPPAPVVFVHGLAGNAASWADLVVFLEGRGWRFGGVPRVAGPALTSGDFYTVELSSPDGLTVEEQGAELDTLIGQVLAANPQSSQVVLVGHSMGGLAARSYLQRSYHDDNVRALITLGTPHLGAALAGACQALSATCRLFGLDPTSVAVAELRPDSPGLQALNDLDARPLPALPYTSIVGAGTPVFGSGQDGDGVVTVTSQVLANVPGAGALAHQVVTVDIADRPECDPVFFVPPTLVFGVRVTHQCEPSDAGAWPAIVDAILAIP